MRYWHEIRNVPIDSVNRVGWGVRDFMQWGRSLDDFCGDMDSVLNYLDNIGNPPLVMMDNQALLPTTEEGNAASSGSTDVNPPAIMDDSPGLVLHDVSGSAVSGRIDDDDHFLDADL